MKTIEVKDGHYTSDKGAPRIQVSHSGDTWYVYPNNEPELRFTNQGRLQWYLTHWGYKREGE